MQTAVGAPLLYHFFFIRAAFPSPPQYGSAVRLAASPPAAALPRPPRLCRGCRQEGPFSCALSARRRVILILRFYAKAMAIR